MNKALRQYRLRKCLADAHFPVQLSTLAQQFQVSEKTIRRDIETLVCDYNAPWFIHDNKIYLDKARQHSIELQDYWFSRQEVESLFALNHIIEQLSPGALKSQLEPFKNRIQGLLTDEENGHDLSVKIKLLEMASRPVQQPIFQGVVQALAENKQMQIVFWNRYKDETLLRTLSPQRLIRYKDNWIVDAYCHLRKGIRSFSLEAIESIELLSHAAKEMPEAEMQAHFQSSYGIYAGKANQQALIKFSPYISRWVQYENWHPEQIGHWSIDQSYQLKIPYIKDEELIQDILKYGEHAEVLEPPELREKIQQKLQNTMKLYAGTSFVHDMC
jgi:predicted DNA-binding transcriptional regulator YafY